MADQRVEMYRPIHKAIRHILYTTVQQLAFTDFTDPASALPALEKMNLTMDMMQEHAGHEQRFVHPLLESKVPWNHSLLRPKPFGR